MNSYDKCKNCGGEYGIHHFTSNQCPVNGREAPLNQKQEWKSTVFEKEDDSAQIVAAQAETIRKLTAFVERVLSEMDDSWIVANPEKYASHRHFQTTFIYARALLGKD